MANPLIAMTAVPLFDRLIGSIEEHKRLNLQKCEMTFQYKLMKRKLSIAKDELARQHVYRLQQLQNQKEAILAAIENDRLHTQLFIKEQTELSLRCERLFQKILEVDDGQTRSELMAFYDAISTKLDQKFLAESTRSSQDILARIESIKSLPPVAANLLGD